jgi:hypothetical protein
MEKRVYPRVESFHVVRYRKGFYSGQKVASTVNLSLGGAKIRTPYGLEKGEGLEIAIGFPADSRAIECRGKVKYVLEQEDGRTIAGIQFERLLENDSLYLWQSLYYLKESAPAIWKFMA